MASDSLNQIGKYIRKTNKQASLALKRNFHKIPTKDRARDTVSSVYPFRMGIEQEGGNTVKIDINFDKPPPDDCAAECIATACEQFNLVNGGHSVTVENPYEAGTVRVYSNGEPLSNVQWYEENSSGGQVYVQVQQPEELIVICYTYIIC